MGRVAKSTVIIVASLALVIGLVAAGCGKKAAPNISSVSPTSGEAGDQVKISGSDFGETQGTVRFGDEAADVVSWSDTSITAKVPSDLKAGEYDLKVENEAGTGNGVQFEVKEKAQDGTSETPVEVIEEYCAENGIDVSGWEYDVTVVSSSDPDWKIDYGFPPEAEGEGIFFLLHKKSGAWTVVAHTSDAGWTTDQLKALGAPTDLTLGPTPDEKAAAQREAINDYAASHGIIIGETPGGIVYKDKKESSIDDTWVLYAYQTYEGMGLTYFLLQEVDYGQSWTVVASGGDGLDPTQYGAPSDLMP